MVEEAGEHFATEEGGKEVILITLDDGGAFISKVVAVKKDVVDGVSVAAVGACGVIPGICSEARRIGGVESVSSDELECS